MLLQKRNPEKDTFPNLWDVSVAGHIEFGESPKEAALREVYEEVGLKLQTESLTYIGSHREKHIHRSDFIDNEFITSFSELKLPIPSLNFRRKKYPSKLIPLENSKI